MSSVVISGDTSGAITLAAPAVAGTNTITLPALTGTVLTSASLQSAFPPNIAGNGPAFSAYQSTSQTLANNVATKVQFQTKEYDTANCYDNTTNYRFTPTVAGYYHVTASMGFASGASARTLFYVFKNGVVWKRLYDTTPTIGYVVAGGCDMYFNGTTDYVEIYVLQTSGYGQNTDNTQSLTYFQASMVRGA